MSQKCRACHAELFDCFCDLGATPPANAYLKQADGKEIAFPLCAYVCRSCFLVQLGQFQTPEEIFGEYFYFSSCSESWIAHGKKYAEDIQKRLQLDSSNKVVEIASNDGYLLQHFLARQIPVLGIEPAANVAKIAIERGVPTISEFFGERLAQTLRDRGEKADLMIGNNVLAHVPDLHDFVEGFRCLLAPDGAITLEFPHLLNLIEQNQFDTIYHEHFSYFSLLSVEKIFEQHDLEIFDVEELSTHGGSLRVYLQHAGASRKIEERVDALRAKEHMFGLGYLKTYLAFNERAKMIRNRLVAKLQDLKKTGKSVVGYGAPAKGNTLLNYCKVNPDLLPFTVDVNPYKQGHFLPGSRIPIFGIEKIEEVRPDYVLVLPWNLKREITEQLSYIQNWGGKFLFPLSIEEEIHAV